MVAAFLLGLRFLGLIGHSRTVFRLLFSGVASLHCFGCIRGFTGNSRAFNTCFGYPCVGWVGRVHFGVGFGVRVWVPTVSLEYLGLHGHSSTLTCIGYLEGRRDPVYVQAKKG